MVKYVTDEIDRIKELFQAKEEKLILERDAAKADARTSASKCFELKEQVANVENKAQYLVEQGKASVLCQASENGMPSQCHLLINVKPQDRQCHAQEMIFHLTLFDFCCKVIAVVVS